MTGNALTVLSQFGAAVLIGLLWILERRHASARDRQLEEAHAVIIAQNGELEALLSVIKENTSAISRLEQSQRQLIGLLQNLHRTGDLSGAAHRQG